MRLVAFESSSPPSPAWLACGTIAEAARNEVKRIARKEA